jgi:hypothetical protein
MQQVRSLGQFAHQEVGFRTGIAGVLVGASSDGAWNAKAAWPPVGSTTP